MATITSVGGVQYIGDTPASSVELVQGGAKFVFKVEIS